MRTREIRVRPQPVVQTDESSGGDELTAKPVMFLRAVAPRCSPAWPCVPPRQPIDATVDVAPRMGLATGPMGCSVHSSCGLSRSKRPSTGWAEDMRVLCASDSNIGGSPESASPVSLGVTLWLFFSYLPMQKRAKISPSRCSTSNWPVIEPSARCARRSSSAKSSQRCSLAASSR